MKKEGGDHSPRHACGWQLAVDRALQQCKESLKEGEAHARFSPENGSRDGIRWWEMPLLIR